MLNKLHNPVIRILVLLTIFLSLLPCSRLKAQSCLELSIRIDKGSYSIKEIIDKFESNKGPVFSYSTSILNQDKKIDIGSQLITSGFFLNLIKESQNINFACANDNKVLIFRDVNEKSENIQKRYHGSIYDVNSKEELFGAYILTCSDVPLGVTDDKGFFSVVTDQDSIKVQYLGYKVKTVVLSRINFRYDIGLDRDNELKGVTIQSNIVRDITDIEGDNGVIAFQDVGHIRGYLGDENGLNLIRQKPGVQSGAEGQTGLIVRGGSPDENLYLYNGVPIYEMSHVAGLSSILQSENIQNIELFKSGIPARYGGRLSSVVNIKTKNGNKLKPEASVAVSLSAVSTHIEGPIVEDKISLNFNARQSIIGLYIDPLVQNVLAYDDFNIGYNDFSGNVHFQVGKNDEFNVFGYTGSDQISLEEVEETIDGNDLYGFINRNEISWRTKLGGVQYQRIWSSDFVMKLLVSSSKYDISSQATYISDRLVNGDNTRNQLDVVSSSSIEDNKYAIHFDYYLFQYDKFSFGSEIIDHTYSPAIVQSSKVGTLDVPQILGEVEIIPAQEWASFIEYKNHTNPWLKINTGLRYSRFISDTNTFSNWEPRVSVSSEWSNKVKTRFNYGRAAQYLHLLSNGGGGFPADLWVPVTSNIAPKVARQLSFTLESNDLVLDFISVSIFTKEVDGLIDYLGAQDVLYSLVNEENPPLVFKNNTDWESRVISGSGTSRGWEIAVQQSFKDFQIEGAYSRVISINKFDEIDNGDTFRSQYDRPNDIKINLGWKPLENWQFNINFSYGSGSPYTLATEEVQVQPDRVILQSLGRNLFRLPSFHHLDLDVKYIKAMGERQLELQFGIYNIYNRLNPFYVYLYKDPLTNTNNLRQISLFPIMPSLSVKYIFLK